MSTLTNRRDFLKHSMYASLAGTAALGMGFPSRAMADCSVVDMPRTLVNLMFYGGMDSRFIFMPAPSHPSPTYREKIWEARKAIYSTDYVDYQAMFDSEYDLVSDIYDPDFKFGIFKGCSSN